MRITKRIEDYIYKQVENKAFASPALKKLEEKAKAIEDKYHAGLNEIKEIAKRSHVALLRELNIPYENEVEFTPARYFNLSHHMTECKEYYEMQANLRNKIHTITNEIIVSMEMGGDKETLTQLLEAVTFE